MDETSALLGLLFLAAACAALVSLIDAGNEYAIWVALDDENQANRPDRDGQIHGRESSLAETDQNERTP